MDPAIYSIPERLIEQYKGCRFVVRVSDQSGSNRELSNADLEGIEYLQIPSPKLGPDSTSSFVSSAAGVPIDIVLSDPAAEYPLLYNFSQLLDEHPIRVSITATPGFSKAVRLALALRFAVRLVVGQPDAGTVDEMKEVLDLYLHGSNITQPVEYFHSLFLSTYRDEPVDLWHVQEDEPSHFRYVTDDGVEQAWPRAAAMSSAEECGPCEFFNSCRGYFKRPDPGYDCSNIKTVFSTINAAADELKESVAASAGVNGGSR